MQVKLRTRGDRIQVCDEQGHEIEGVVEVHMEPWRPGQAPRFAVVIETKVAQLDGAAEVERVEAPAVSAAPAAAPADAGDAA